MGSTERSASTEAPSAVDVLIIGAGIAGISAACHLRMHCEDLTFAVVERRQDLGGTWDLFRYPGIRSDSSMQNYGFGFRLWTAPRVLSPGSDIKAYIRETAEEYRVTEHIVFGVRINELSWSSDDNCWTAHGTDETDGSARSFTARFLVGCTGYFDYDTPHRPEFPGEEQFAGPIIHPQHWPTDLDVDGKKIVVIGSGATAMTLVPTLAGQAELVTLLQRSPSYVLSVPAVDPVAATLDAVVPKQLLYRLTRVRNIHAESWFYMLSRRHPTAARGILLNSVRWQLRGKTSMTGFSPRYRPWDQRVCLVPDGDLFDALRTGRAEVVTDEIEAFTSSGIRLKSGEELSADIIVTATGLRLKIFGGIAISVDGEPVEPADRMLYKSAMLEGLPNLVLTVGHTNFSWTLKADAVSTFMTRLLRHMQQHGYATAIARDHGANATASPIYDNLSSGYLSRASALLPRQGKSGPWRTVQDIAHDSTVLRHAPIDDGVLEFDQSATRGRDIRSLVGALPRPIRLALASLS